MIFFAFLKQITESLNEFQQWEECRSGQNYTCMDAGDT